MIVPDANLIIYAHNPSAPKHRKSRSWFEEVLSGDEPVGIPDLCVYAFLRFVTNPKLAPKAITFEQAVQVASSWLAEPHVSIVNPGRRHWSILSKLAEGSRLRGTQLTDAIIAAIAIESGATIFTHDSDFARFPGLRWVDPLAT